MKIPSFFRCLEKKTVLSDAGLWTIPNIVTIAGFFFAVEYVVLAVAGYKISAFVALVFMALSDMLDGALARTLWQYSEIGKKLDWLRDWWYAILVIIVPVSFLPHPFILFTMIVVVLETELLVLSRGERLGKIAGGWRHFALKTHSALILLFGAPVLFYPELALSTVLMYLIVVMIPVLSFRYAGRNRA